MDIIFNQSILPLSEFKRIGWVSSIKSVNGFIILNVFLI